MKFHLLALAFSLVAQTVGYAQCNAGRQIDTTNLNLGLQAAPVQGACANGQCGAAASALTAPAPLAYTLPQTSVMVNTPRVAVNVGVQRAYQPLYVVTPPLAMVAPAPQYALVSAPVAASATATATAGIQAEVVAPVAALAVDPSVQIANVSACAAGNCGGRPRILRSIFRPRRSISVARSRSVTFN